MVAWAAEGSIDRSNCGYLAFQNFIRFVETIAAGLPETVARAAIILFEHSALRAF